MSKAWIPSWPIKCDTRTQMIVVWGALLAVATAIYSTYARQPASNFYHVSSEGIQGGLSRVLIFSNFPASLIALAPLGLAIETLRSRLTGRRRSIVTLTGMMSAALCLVTALPGVVKQSDLDAKAVNLIPLLGVLMAGALSILATREGEVLTAAAWSVKDMVLLWLTIILTVLSLPWIFADLGIYIGDIPILGAIFYSKQITPGEALHAVHLGHHHGLDGLLFLFTGFVLARTARTGSKSNLVRIVAGLLGLMVSYGFANFVNDFWLEQVVKRGWSSFRIHDMLIPDLSIAWGLVIVGGAASWSIFFRPAGSSPASS